MIRYLILLAFLIAMPSSGWAQGTEAPLRFPELTAENLLGESFDIPDDLPGEPRVIHIAFQQRQQLEVNTWLTITDALEADYEGLRVFEFPTISWPYRIMKPVIDNGMRGGIPSDAARGRTITIFTRVSRFIEATGLPGNDDIATLLIDAEGYIRWRALGVHTDEKESALRAAIEGLRAEG